MFTLFIILFVLIIAKMSFLGESTPWQIDKAIALTVLLLAIGLFIKLFYSLN